MLRTTRRWVQRVQETSNAMDLPMSMLNLHINRSGRKLKRTDRARLEAAKGELRRAFSRKPRGRLPASPRRKAAA